MSPQFRFIARNWQGEKVSSVLSAANRNDALGLLNISNLVPINLKEISESRSQLPDIMPKLLQRLGFKSYSSRDMMIFCRQFATMLQAGLSILHCLKVLYRQKEISVLNKRIKAVALEIEQGSSLADALRSRQDNFPVIMVNMVEVGETGGTLDSVMERMADHFEKQHDLQEKIRSATLYPIFIIGIAIVVVAVMVVFVLPQFAQIFNSIGMEMPFYTRVLLSFSKLLREQWLILLLFSSMVAAALTWYKQTVKGRQIFDLIRLHFPLFGRIYRQALTARFSRILGTLLAGGVTLCASLELADKAIDNVIISKLIHQVGTSVNRGETIADTLQTIKYFPPLLSEMARIGEETGTLEKTLHGTAIFYEREVTYFVERLSTILEPVLLLLVGLFIGFLVFSILSPMYQVFQMI